MVPDGQGAGEMHSIGTAHAMQTSWLPGLLFDMSGQLDRADSSPELLPHRPGDSKVVCGHVMVTSRGGERGAYLRVREPTGQRGVTAIPQHDSHSVPKRERRPVEFGGIRRHQLPNRSRYPLPSDVSKLNWSRCSQPPASLSHWATLIVSSPQWSSGP